MPFDRTFAIGLFGAVGGIAAYFVGGLVFGTESFGVRFPLFCLGAVGCNAYWWLFRFARELSLEGDRLLWRAPLRHGELLLAELTEIRPMRAASNVAVIEALGGRRVVVLADKGITAFTAEIARRRPGLPVRLGWMARLNEQLPGSSRLDRP